MSFYEKLETFLKEKGILQKMDMEQIKTIIYRDLDDLIAKIEDLNIGKKIGVGASSEVFYGNFKYCPCAIKKIKLELMNPKQIVKNNFLIIFLELHFE